MSPLAKLIIMGLVIVLIASARLGQKVLDRWTQATGRAPLIQKSRGSWAAYMQATNHEMPPSVRKQIALYQAIGWIALGLIGVVMAFDEARHR